MCPDKGMKSNKSVRKVFSRKPGRQKTRKFQTRKRSEKTRDISNWRTTDLDRVSWNCYVDEAESPEGSSLDVCMYYNNKDSFNMKSSTSEKMLHRYHRKENSFVDIEGNRMFSTKSLSRFRRNYPTVR